MPAVRAPVHGPLHDEATIKGKLMMLAKAVQAEKLGPEYLAAQAAKSKEISGYDILETMKRVV
jgi:hypothetical protein